MIGFLSSVGQQFVSSALFFFLPVVDTWLVLFHLLLTFFVSPRAVCRPVGDDGHFCYRSRRWRPLPQEEELVQTGQEGPREGGKRVSFIVLGPFGGASGGITSLFNVISICVLLSSKPFYC